MNRIWQYVQAFRVALRTVREAASGPKDPPRAEIPLDEVLPRALAAAWKPPREAYAELRDLADRADALFAPDRAQVEALYAPFQQDNVARMEIEHCGARRALDLLDMAAKRELAGATFFLEGLRRRVDLPVELVACLDRIVARYERERRAHGEDRNPDLFEGSGRTGLTPADRLRLERVIAPIERDEKAAAEAKTCSSDRALQLLGEAGAGKLGDASRCLRALEARTDLTQDVQTLILVVRSKLRVQAGGPLASREA